MRRRVAFLLLAGVAFAACAGAVALGRTGAGPPPYDLTFFTATGARTAWVVETGNAPRNPAQTLIRTSDAGRRWTSVTPPGLGRATRTTGITGADFATPSEAWITVGTGPHAPLLFTADGGRHWRQVGRAPVGCTARFVSRADGWCFAVNGAAGSEAVAVYRTANGGRTWREVSRNGFPPARPTPDAIPLGCDKSVTATSRQVGFAASFCAGPEQFIDGTYDGGARWHQQLLLSLPTGDSGGFTPVVGHGDAAAAGFTVYGRRGPSSTVVYVTRDGGNAWREVRPPGRPRAWGVDIVTPRVWKLIAGRTELSTTNAGASWTRIHANMIVGRAAASGAMFTSAADGWTFPLDDPDDTVLRTSDGGRRWNRIHIPVLGTIAVAAGRRR